MIIKARQHAAIKAQGRNVRLACIALSRLARQEASQLAHNSFMPPEIFFVHTSFHKKSYAWLVILASLFSFASFCIFLRNMHVNDSRLYSYYNAGAITYPSTVLPLTMDGIEGHGLLQTRTD